MNKEIDAKLWPSKILLKVFPDYREETIKREVKMLVWNKTLELGISEIDSQHKKLVTMINDLGLAMREGKSREIIENIVKKMASYIHLHFTTEEKYFQKFNYKDSELHVKEHKNFVTKVSEFQEKLKESKEDLLSIEVIHFLTDWLVNHIQHTDKQYVKCFKENGLE